MKIRVVGKYDEKWIDVDLSIKLNDAGATEESVKRIIDHIAHKLHILTALPTKRELEILAQAEAGGER